MKKLKCPNCGLKYKPNYGLKDKEENEKKSECNIYITGAYSAEVNFMYEAEVKHKDSETEEDSKFIFTSNYNLVPTSFNCNKCDHQWGIDVEDYIL